MMRRHERILHDILTLPTAPFTEDAVVAYIRRFSADRPTLTCKADRYGNLVVSYDGDRPSRSKRQPIALAAHLDHPGFVAQRMVGAKRLRAAWRGGVRPEFFRNARVRFYERDRWIRGRITSIHETRDRPNRWGARVESVDVAIPAPVSPGAVGMWDLPEPRVRGSRMHARACDDLAGAAGMLCALDEMIRSRSPGSLVCLFTRAEEVGFVGAIAACRIRTLPKSTPIVAVECSSALPGAALGDGPILRVGDRTHVFTPSLTAYCRRVADALAADRRTFRYQRKLMDGGTCESTVYCEYGYEATGVCLALGNYHNMNRRTGRIAAEYIDLNDFALLVRWFVALGQSTAPTASATQTLRQSLDRRYDSMSHLLKTR